MPLDPNPSPGDNSGMKTNRGGLGSSGAIAPRRFLCSLFAIILAGIATAPLQADPPKSQMTVGVQPPPPVAHPPGHNLYYPYYPYLPLRPKPKVRCEQDRLLTDTTPCGNETVEPQFLPWGAR
jgi:hypothetical protein